MSPAPVSRPASRGSGSALAPAAEFSVPEAHEYDRRSPVRWFVSHVRRHSAFTLYVIVGTVVYVSLRTYIQWILGDAVDAVAGPDALRSLSHIALFIIGSALLQSLINLTTAYSNEVVAQRIERDAREELFVSLLSKSQTFHDAQRIGDIMARATNDVKQLNLMVSPALNLIYRSCLELVVPLAAIAVLDPRLLLAPTMFVFASGIALRRYVRRLGPLSGRMRAQFGQMNAVLNEILNNVKVVRNFVQDAREKEAFSREARAYRDLAVAYGDIQARYFPLLFVGLTIVLGLMHAIYLERSGVLTLGDVVRYVGLLVLLRFPTFISIFSFNLVQMGLASAERVLSLMNSDTDIDQNSAGHDSRMQGRVVFDNVSFRYRPDAPWVLRDISFEVPPGARLAIVGPTGSGKTTLVKLLQRLFDTTEGQIRIDGIDVRDWSLGALRGQMGVIEQDTFLFSRTIAENISFGRPSASRAEVEAAAVAAQAHDFIVELEKGYDSVVGARGLTLSGGQKQRLAIARALLADPRVLALDDATSAVDSATEDRIQKAINGLLRGRTSFVITHRRAQIRHADLILVMKRGRIVAQGTHDELIRRSSDYRDVFEVYGAVLPPLEA